MSKILKGLNEVNPHNYDSDWDYQNAVASSGRSRSSYRSQEDDTSDADIAYSKKMYQLSQKQKRDADHDRLATGTNEEQLDELSNEKLGQYKTAAGKDASKADSEGDYKRADKRFSGIVKATKKQFANDTKTVKEDINVVYSKAKSLLTQLDENTQQKVINALTKSVDDEEQKPFKTGYPRVNNPKILGTQNRAKSAYYPPSKPNVKKLDKPLPENLGNELKSKSLEALQQVKQQLEQQRIADLEQWEKDFKQNTVSKFTAREPNLRQRATSTSMVAMPGEKHSDLKARLGQLDKAIEKQGILDNLVQKLDKKGLLTPNIEAGVDTSMLVRDGARDNYVELNKKLDKALEYVKNRLLTNKAAYAKPKAIDEDDGVPTRMRMNDYYDQADAIQEKLKQAIQMGDKARMQELNKQRDELDAHVKKYGMMPEDIAEEQLDELSCWSGYHRVAGTKAGFPGSCAKNKTNEQELDEIDRRGFLKGMGAAAVAGVAGGAKAANFQSLTPQQKDIVMQVIWSWIFTIDKEGKANELPFTSELTRFINIYDGSKKWVLDSAKNIDFTVKKRKSEQDPNEFYAESRKLLANAQDYIDDLKELNDLGEGIKQQAQQTSSNIEAKETIKGFTVIYGPAFLSSNKIKLKQRFIFHLKNQIDRLPDVFLKKISNVNIYIGSGDLPHDAWAFYVNPRTWLAKGFPKDNIGAGGNIVVGNWERGHLNVTGQSILIHELAHAYQYADPAINNPIALAYKNAMENKLYSNTYASKNPAEYFGELTAMYFGESGEPPFNKQGLKKYDPTGYNMIEVVWGLMKESVEQGVAEEKHSCPHCGGEMVSEELMNEKKDACYYKVKSRHKVWPSAYASGALVKCRKSGASNWGNGGKKNESSILEGIEQADESLHDWFNKEKWVRMDTKGKIKGPCAKEPGEGKPKCLPQSKAHSLGKKGRASAAQRKRREDPNPERSGKAINVDTKKKSNENVDENWKKKLGAAALTGAMALGAAGASADNTRRVTPDGQGGFTGGMKPSATVVAPDNTPSATPPTSTSNSADPYKGLVRAERADRQAKTITVGGQEYRLVEISPTDMRPRGGQQIVVPQAVLGERSIGNYMGILAGNTVYVISK